VVVNVKMTKKVNQELKSVGVVARVYLGKADFG